MENRDEIIVFWHFDTGIDANIAKTKLDAYDIPCFLTEENMAALYPGQHAFAFRVRLHIFKKDIDLASKVLMAHHTNAAVSENNCPRCHSQTLERDFPKKFGQKPLNALGILFFGVFMPHKKVNHCLDCDNEF
jgi:hypothetical protein